MRFFILILSLLWALPATAETIKLSNSGICHDVRSPFYERTKNFTPYDTLEACLQVGRLPKNLSSSTTPSSSTQITTSPTYDREAHFGSWLDTDNDCFNTRHEILAELSTGPVRTQGCRVVTGRWIDPYTNQIFTQSRHLDVDHLVPLYWAWQHGAHAWPQETRLAFANDARNLFAVDAGTNRAKGAKGPLEWLPPNSGFHCQYLVRFERIILTYKLTQSTQEKQRFQNLKAQKCG